MLHEKKTFVDDSRYSNLNPPPDGGGGGENVMPSPRPKPTVFPKNYPVYPYYYPYYAYPYLYDERLITEPSPPPKETRGNNKNILYLGVMIIGVALLLKAMK